MDAAEDSNVPAGFSVHLHSRCARARSGTTRHSSPASAFLTEPKKSGISEAARELTTVAASEEYEGKKQEWTGILEAELGKARDIQSESAGLKFRELEQAVFATFLHSQPPGHKALTRDLMVLLGPSATGQNRS